MIFLKKLVPIIFFGSIFVVVIYQVEPPKSFSQISTFQFTSFFLPLTLTLVFLFNFIFKSLLKSIILTLVLILLLLTQTLYHLNPFIPLFLIAATLLLLIFLPKYPSFNKFSKKSYQTQIPKLSHLSKQR